MNAAAFPVYSGGFSRSSHAAFKMKTTCRIICAHVLWLMAVETFGWFSLFFGGFWYQEVRQKLDKSTGHLLASLPDTLPHPLTPFPQHPFPSAPPYDPDIFRSLTERREALTDDSAQQL
ncbi:hypothetical protein PoB_007342800 [Plakobranchus ocellatus]|uniref:Uncharacterized protein n=1 Tax=Plakobranchus ocellatus TaxID=259542 RepID=A0AAV4DRL4_9GAST|nr:hypothetical protein PoB_007342800 [Plakobranchus ocellatus]